MDEKIIIFVRIILNIFGNDYRKRKVSWWTTSWRSFLLLTNNIKTKQNNESKNYGIIRNDLQPDGL